MSYIDDGSQDRGTTTALADLRSTVKWLVASAGGTAAVLVGGLQLTRLHSLGTWAGVVSALAAAVAIGLALLLLTAAARILAVPRPSSTQLSDAEVNTGALDPDSPTESSDPVVQWVQAHAEQLLAGERTVTDLCSFRNTARKATNDLLQGQTVQWYGAQIAPSDEAEVARIERAAREADASLAALENAVLHHQCQQKLTVLLKWFPRAGVVFIAAVIVFAIASASK